MWSIDPRTGRGETQPWSDSQSPRPVVIRANVATLGCLPVMAPKPSGSEREVSASSRDRAAVNRSTSAIKIADSCLADR